MTEILVILGIIIFLVAAFWFVLAYIQRTDPVAIRLAAEKDVDEERPLGEMAESFAAQVKQSPKEMNQVERDLRRAGRYSKNAYADFQGGRVFTALMIMTGALFAILAVGIEEQPLVFWIGGVGLLLAGLAYAAPRFSLTAEGNRRVGRLEGGLPDSLDMMTMSIAGGLTLRNSLDHVAREIRPAHPELAFELAIVNEQARLGTIQNAFRNFADRTDSPEIRSLSALVSDSERLGTNVETTIREHADSMRRSIRQRADERASKTNIKLIMPFALLLVPAMLLMLWAPPLMTLSAALRRELQPGGALSAETLNESIANANTDTDARRRGGNAANQAGVRNIGPRDIGPRQVGAGGQGGGSRVDSVFGPSDSGSGVGLQDPRGRRRIN